MLLGLTQAIVREEVPTDNLYPPLGIGYISSYLKKHLNFQDIVIERFSDKLLSHKPDIVGMSSTTMNYNKAIDIATKAKQGWKAIAIVGGPHISLLPESLHKSIDIGVMGEGELTAKELFEYLLSDTDVTSKKVLNKEKLEKIKGIVFHKDGKKIITEERELIGNLDSLPYPDRELLKGKWVNDIGKNGTVSTSRGCPFHCSFCSTRVFWRKYRGFSAEYVANEIEYLHKNYRTKHVTIQDDLFLVEKERLGKIVSLLEEKGLTNKISFECTARANLITDETSNLMKRMNVKIIHLGIESYSDKILEEYNKKGINKKVIDNALMYCKQYDLRVCASFIIGAPQETQKDVLETYVFLRDNMDKMMWVNMGELMALPGTKYWKMLEEKGKVSPYMNWDLFNSGEEAIYSEDFPYVSEVFTKDNFYALLLLFKEVTRNYSLRIEKEQIVNTRGYKLLEKVRGALNKFRKILGIQ